MKKLLTVSTALLLTASAALAGDLSLGVKLFSDGLYSLAAKTFSENLSALEGKEFKKYYRYAYLSFLKSSDYQDLKKLVEFWKKNYPNFHKGELLALETLIKVKEGTPIKEAFPKKELSSLSIEEKVGFFKALSAADLNSDQLLYILSVSTKDIDLKGALKDSGFLEEALKRATKENDYALIDFIFDNYGRWFKGKEENLQFVRYLERKKRFPEALVEAQKLYRKYPSQETRFELARAYYLNGKYKEVLKLLKTPSTTREKYLLAWTYFKLNRPRKIAQLVGLNVEKPQMPKKLQVLYSFFNADFNLPLLMELYPELYPKALIFSFSPSPPQKEVGSSHDLAFIYFEKGYFTKARKELERAVQNPTDKNLLGRSLFLFGKISSVNAQVGSVIYNQLLSNYQGTPYYDESVVPAARVYLYSGSAPVAQKLLEFAYNNLKERSREVRELLGHSYLITGDYKKAAEVLSERSGQFGKSLLAYSLFQLGKLKEAYQQLRKTTIFPEANGGRLVYLAKSLDREKDLRRIKFQAPLPAAMAAIVSKDAKRAKELFPSAPTIEKVALSLFLVNYYKEREPQKAFYYLTAVIDATGDKTVSTYARELLNYLAFKTGNYAPVLFNDPYFIAYNPENDITSTSTLIAKAQDYASTGQFGKAYGLLKLALERTTSPQLRREIVERLVKIDLKRKNYNKALIDANLLPEGSQKDKDLKNYLLFKTYLAMGRLVDAYNAAKEVSDLNSVPKEERSSFIAKLAHYYKLTGNEKKALKLTNYLAEKGNLKAVDYDDLVSLALLAQERGELQTAEKLIEAALNKAKSKEQKAESLFWKASIEAQTGRTDDAIIDYMKIAYDYKGVEPWASTALYKAAQLFESKGEYKQALKLYQKVAKLKKGTKEGEVAAEKVKSLLKKLGEEE
ncbi:CDC27 family protein [Thermovibrio sp.]